MQGFFFDPEAEIGGGWRPQQLDDQLRRGLGSGFGQLSFLRFVHSCWEQTAPEQFHEGMKIVGYENHQLVLRCASSAQAAALRRQASSICSQLRANYKRLRYLRGLKVRAHPHYAEAAPPSQPAQPLSLGITAEARQHLLRASERVHNPELAETLRQLAAYNPQTLSQDASQ